MVFYSITLLKKHFNVHEYGNNPQLPKLIKSLDRLGYKMWIVDDKGININDTPSLRKAKDFKIYVEPKEIV